MNQENLYEFYLSLMPNIMEELFFFIPEKQILEHALELVPTLKKHDMLNKVLVIDKYKGPMYYDKNRNDINIVLKSNKLEKNIFMLLEKKSKVSKHEFDYVLNRYYELLEILYKAIEWMDINLKKHIPADNKIAGTFSMQFSYFQIHFKTFVKTFYIDKESVPTGNFDVKKLIDTCFVDVSDSFKRYSLKGIDHLNPKRNQVEQNLPKQNKTSAGLGGSSKEKKKKPLVSETGAEHMLLKTFFGIG